MVQIFHDFHQLIVGGYAHQGQTAVGQGFPIVVVEFIAMAMALIDDFFAVGFKGSGSLIQNFAGISAQTHGRTHLIHIPLFGHQVNDRIRRIRIQFAGMCAYHAGQMSGVFHHGHLHPQADAEQGHLLFSGPADGVEHAVDTAGAKAAGDDNAVDSAQHFCHVPFGDIFRVHPTDLHLYIIFNAAMG